MEQLWRTLRRLIFLFVTIFISANAIAYLVLNNAFVHDWFRKQANGYLEDYGVEATIGPVALNFLETKLTISGIKIAETDGDKKTLAEIEGFIIGFDPWTVSSGWLPAMKFVTLDGWNLDLRLIKKFRSDANAKQVPFKINDLLGQLRKFFGHQIELKNGRIFQSKNNTVMNDIRVNGAFAKIEENGSNRGLTLIADLGKSTLCVEEREPCSRQISLESFEINSEMNAEGTARIERLDARSSLGNWLLSGQVQIGDNLAVSNYNLKVEGEANATPWFALLGLEGRGRFKANVFLNPEGTDGGKNRLASLLPAVHGQMAWSNLNLAGYDIYSGTADVQYVDLKVA
ncbi:hypothetical protein EBR21_07250, partial [bacterium]|nr:hypothetical protein [bacterium]